MGKKEIAAALSTARKYRGFTQADAAKATGLTYQAISNYERGTNRIESIVLRNLCLLYNVSVESVLICHDWPDDYVSDFLHARSDEERIEILKSCGPCSRFICEYNDLFTPADTAAASNSSIDLTDSEMQVLSILRKMSADQQQAVLDFLNRFSPD